jgi:hypothetical protein
MLSSLTLSILAADAHGARERTHRATEIVGVVSPITGILTFGVESSVTGQRYMNTQLLHMQ